MTGSPDRDAAFHDFVAARYPALVRLGYLLVGERAHAEDLVQSALLRAYGAWGGIREPATAEAYTRKIMIRLAVRWRQRRWRSEIPSGLVAATTGADPWADADLEATVRRALLTLPVRQRAVLVLRFYEDLSEAQTAEILGCSAGTVKSRTSRGLAALRATGLLDSETDEPSPEVPRHG